MAPPAPVEDVAPAGAAGLSGPAEASRSPISPAEVAGVTAAAVGSGVDAGLDEGVGAAVGVADSPRVELGANVGSETSASPGIGWIDTYWPSQIIGRGS